MGCYYLIHSLLEYTSSHKSEIEDMLTDVDKRTIERGVNPAVSDSFAIEYKSGLLLLKSLSEHMKQS